MAIKEIIAHFPFVAFHEAFTAERCGDTPFTACVDDEVHQTAYFLAVEVKLRISGGTSARENCEKAPFLYSGVDKHLFKLVKLGE